MKILSSLKSANKLRTFCLFAFFFFAIPLIYTQKLFSCDGNLIYKPQYCSHTPHFFLFMRASHNITCTETYCFSAQGVLPSRRLQTLVCCWAGPEQFRASAAPCSIEIPLAVFSASKYGQVWWWVFHGISSLHLSISYSYSHQTPSLRVFNSLYFPSAIIDQHPRHSQSSFL